MPQRIVICTGGSLEDWALQYIEKEDLLIGADSGARFLAVHGYRIDAAIGDFDSVSLEDMDLIRKSSVRTIECDPIDKDYTDTELAVRLALDMKPKELLILGALGTRFDHTLANVYLLALAAEQAVSASIIDRHNKITVIRNNLTLRKEGYDHVSLLPLSAVVSGITLTGFQYPLTNAELTIGQTLGISNVLEAEAGSIEITSGLLLVIQSRD